MHKCSSRVLLFMGVVVMVSGMFGCEQQDDSEQTSKDSGMREYKKIRALFKEPLAFKPKEWEGAVKAYTSGGVEGEGGVVELPENLAGTTMDGRMWVTKGHSFGDLYMFITWRGKGSNLRGYIYRLANEDDSTAMNIDRIKVLGPRISNIGDTVAEIKLQIKSISTPGWYKVSRSMD